MRKLFIALLATFILVSSCRKPDPVVPAEPQLPAITQSGKNTFGCLVDGKVWLPKGGGMLSPIETEYNDNNGYFSVNANQSSNIGLQSVTLTLWQVKRDTTIEISNYSDGDNGQFFRFADYISSPYSHNYYYPIGQLYTGELTISKLDTANRIMAGTFWFDAIDTVNNKTVQIREGRFDVTY